MLDNWHTRILGKRVELVPYCRHHVPVYNAWMQDKELLELTASEPLSIEDEFKMQQTWLHSKDKCTFIVLTRDKKDDTNQRSTERELETMIGDTNLFLQHNGCAEIELMIANEEHRGKGLGKEVLALMIEYAFSQLKIEKFVAKIKTNNEASLALFEKFGFVEYESSEVFQEVSLKMNLKDDPQVHRRVADLEGQLERAKYVHNENDDNVCALSN